MKNVIKYIVTFVSTMAILNLVGSVVIVGSIVALWGTEAISGGPIDILGINIVWIGLVGTLVYYAVMENK